MANLNNKAKAENTYDAIVVGSGITGGYAAMELTAKGKDAKPLVTKPAKPFDPSEFGGGGGAPPPGAPPPAHPAPPPSKAPAPAPAPRP